MPFFSRKKHHFSPPPANGPRLSSQSAQQPRPVCTLTWSARAPHSGPSSSPFPRDSHTLTATATAAGELFLFGGDAGDAEEIPSSDVYMFSTRDFSTTLLQTSGEVPSPRFAHGTAFTGTTLLICGGIAKRYGQNVLNHNSLYLLNLGSREWTRIMVNGTGPSSRIYHTTTVVGSKLFVFGGRIGGNVFNDMWTLDLDCLKSHPHWESCEPTPGNEKPPPRHDHVSVTTEDRIIIFGGRGDEQDIYNDTWSFDISTRKWTELQCTGSIPSPRGGHAAVLVDDVMYVFGGYSGKTDLDDLYALQLSTRRWFNFHSVGPTPRKRSAHPMASDGTRVFVLGGYSKGARADEISLIHAFDTKHIEYPDPEPNASSEARGASHLQNAPAVSGHPSSLQITHERNPSPNGRPLELTGVNRKPRRVPADDVSEGSTEYYGKFVAPHSSSEGEITRLELEWQPSGSLAAQTERDQRIARLTDELALKNALLEQAEAHATEAAKRAGLHAGRPLTQTSLVEQRDAEVVDMQARLRGMQARLDELLPSRDLHVGQYEKELANVRAKLEANESELATVRLRLTDAEKGLTKSRAAEADTSHAQTATGSVNRDEDQVTRRLMERVRALEAEMISKKWNEKSIEEMECRNEG